MTNIRPTRQVRMVPPPHLPESQHEIWNRIVNAVPDYHFLPSHIDLLTRYCHLVKEIERYTAWEQEILESQGPSGLTYETAQGAIYERPECVRLRKTRDELAKLAASLRILPTENRRDESTKRQQAEDNAHQKGASETEEKFGTSLLFDA